MTKTIDMTTFQKRGGGRRSLLSDFGTVLESGADDGIRSKSTGLEKAAGKNLCLVTGLEDCYRSIRRSLIMNLGFGNLAQNRAFTLAEVLITLGIIGIIAAMTLPALITRNQNKALEASLKKNQTFILQAFEMYQAQNGERLRANEVNIGCAKLGLCLHDKIIPYFKILKDCKYGSSEKACISYFGNDTVGDKRNSNKYKTYSGKPLQKLNLLDDGQFILQDGSLILMENLGEEGRDVLISVDVNVLNKNPNRRAQTFSHFS